MRWKAVKFWTPWVWVVVSAFLTTMNIKLYYRHGDWDYATWAVIFAALTVATTVEHFRSRRE